MLLLGGDPSLRARLGAAGRRHVERRMSWEATLDRFETAVVELLPARDQVGA
jgi:hypothetical protein